MKISVVITAYNVEAYIKEAIDSVLNQTYKNIEIVVVNDKSTDSTPEILNSYGDKIIVVNNTINMGAGYSRKVGSETATGEYILLLDGDDWLNPDFIEALVKRAEETGADIVSGGIIINKEDGSYDITGYGDTITEGIDKVNKFWKERIVFMNNKIIRKYLYEKHPYCTRRFIEDTPTIIPHLYYANKVAYVDNSGYHYRMQANSLTHQAKPFKIVLFRLLCVFDLIAFFTKEDKEYLKTIPLQLSFGKLLNELRALNPTQEMISEYQEEWNTFTCNLLKIIK